MSSGSRLVFVLTVLAVLAACGANSTGPTPPVVNPPVVACPADVAVAGAPGAGEAVTYTAPVATNGTPPVTTTCSAASGSVFPVGTSTVSCTAKDALSRTASCTFTVTVAAAHLGAVKFDAFGDSITAGENGTLVDNALPAFPPCAASTSSALARRTQARPEVIDVANAYPTQLLTMLQARFPSQVLTMINEGSPGETAADGAVRLATCVLTTDQPGVLMILEGINDIGGAATSWAPTNGEEQAIVKALRADVTNALGAGVSFVFVSTILPVRECEDNDDCHFATGDSTMINMSINQVNAMILAGIPGATVVDGNAAFVVADPTFVTLISDDGLHPLPPGNTVLAKTFLNGIVTHVPITAIRRARR